MTRTSDLPSTVGTWVEPALVIRTASGAVHPEYAAVKLAIGFPPGTTQDTSMTTDSAVARAFLDYSTQKLTGEYWPRLRHCVESLTAEQLWWRPNEASNSIGNILLHLNGNVGQWILAGLGGRDKSRDRPSEFSQREPVARAVLLEQLDATVAEAARVIGSLSAADLTAPRAIQGYQVTGLEAVYHVVEHFGMHYGQIVFITKQLRGSDLGFYRDLGATGRRE
jgi:uncharacterized damage-inducible protein DinB